MILRENHLGWKLDKPPLSHGFLIRKSGSFIKTLLSMGPFLVNLIIVVLRIITGADSTPAIIPLPFTFLLSLYAFKDVELYLNAKRRIVMDRWFYDRFSFEKLSFRIHEEGALFQLLLVNNTNSNEHIAWESTSIDEVMAIEDLLKKSLQISETHS